MQSLHEKLFEFCISLYHSLMETWNILTQNQLNVTIRHLKVSKSTFKFYSFTAPKHCSLMTNPYKECNVLNETIAKIIINNKSST